MTLKQAYVGKWRIDHMDEWDKDFIDLVAPGHFTIKKDGTGFFQFGVVEGELDCRIEDSSGTERLAFSWQGFDEGDEVSGRGWAEVEGKKMKGWIHFHMGDDSGFTARKT